MTSAIPLARTADGRVLTLPAALANRHGLVTGATGTGKTVTLQVLAEAFSRIGVPSVLADVKGDLSGLAAPGSPTPKLVERLARLGIDPPAWSASPVVFWDVFGRSGHAARATISDMGPLLLGRLLNLNETQRGVLTLVFRIADDNGLLLLDLNDLRTMLQFVGDHTKRFTTEYGNMSTASVGAIQRALVAVEEQGGEHFFGEPMLDIDDLIRTTADGDGIVNVISADKLIEAPTVYASFLLWMLAELFERLPEVGDLEKPRVVFFFDEAHVLFDETPEALLDKIEQVVRLIRSKGVGVYFITQNPLDVPDKVLAQLGNRVQHALRAFTPRDLKAVKTAATTLRVNPAIDTETAISELAVGEALVSLLDDRGTPGMVERAWILPPSSRIGALTADERRAVVSRSTLAGRYDMPIDRESAYEVLRARATERVPETTAERTTGSRSPAGGARPAPGGLNDILFGSTGPRGGRREGVIESAARSAARSVGSGLGREILRGVLGSIFGSKR